MKNVNAIVCFEWSLENLDGEGKQIIGKNKYNTLVIFICYSEGNSHLARPKHGCCP